MDWLIEPFSMPFMRTALAAALCVGVSCASLGAYVVRRRMAFVGDAMAHTTLPGLVIAHLVGVSLPLGALSAALITAFAIGWLARRRIGEDTAIGIVFTGMFALGIVLMSRTRSYRDLAHMLFGNILGVGWNDLGWMAATTAGVAMVLFFFRKELELTSFDATHAAVMGIRVHWMNDLLLVLLAFAIVSGIQAVGVVLTSTLLVTPAAAAGTWTRDFRWSIVLSAIIASLSAVLGLMLSYHFDVAAGASIVLTCCGLFLAGRWLRTFVRRDWRDSVSASGTSLTSERPT